jgi:cytochrome oxidase assembly protein ShyY1
VRTGFAFPVIIALAAFIVLIGLGTWQIERKAWKEALIAALAQRLAAEPAPLPPPAQWSSLRAADEEFRRVSFVATFDPGEQALIYASGSAFRSDVSGPGYWVFAPARLAAGATVVVNRGFVPEGRQDAKDNAPGREPVTLTGAVRWPEQPGWFAPQGEPARNLWFVRDHVAVAAAKGWRDVAPFYVELETPTGPAGLPRPGRLTANLRNDHLQYALTWYGLAAVLAIVFGLWARSRRREQA